MRVMYHAVEDCVCNSGIADGVMPVIDRQLADNNGGSLFVAVVSDFQKVTSLFIV